MGILVLQPDSSTSKENYLDENAPTTNHNSETLLTIQPFSTGSFVKRMLLGFDVSSIPPTASILSATLTLYFDSEAGGGATVNIETHSVTRSWTAAGSTWNTYNGSNNWTTSGGDFDATVLSTTTISGTGGTSYNWTIPSSIITGWLSGTNNGLLLKADNENQSVNDRYFASSFNSTSANRPKLTVVYGANTRQLMGVGS